MMWSLLYGLTRSTLGVMLLRIRGDAAKDIEIMVLRHQLASCAGRSTARCRSPQTEYCSPRYRDCCPGSAGTHSS
jgi:hypothetical protein